MKGGVGMRRIVFRGSASRRERCVGRSFGLRTRKLILILAALLAASVTTAGVASAESMSNPPDPPPGVHAANFCFAAISGTRDRAIYEVIGAVIGPLVHGNRVKNVVKLSRTAKGQVEVNYLTENGRRGSAALSLATLITRLVGHYPAPEARLFVLIGPPAVHCIRAASYYNHELARKITRNLPTKVWPPNTGPCPWGQYWHGAGHCASTGPKPCVSDRCPGIDVTLSVNIYHGSANW